MDPNHSQRYLERELRAQGFTFRTFQENLGRVLNQEALESLNVLGKDFFSLVDALAGELFLKRAGDSPLLGLDLQAFLWEAQIFANLFVRGQSPNILKLRDHAKQTLARLGGVEFHDSYFEELELAYEEYFFLQDAGEALLV